MSYNPLSPPTILVFEDYFESIQEILWTFMMLFKWEDNGGDTDKHDSRDQSGVREKTYVEVGNREKYKIDWGCELIYDSNREHLQYEPI